MIWYNHKVFEIVRGTLLPKYSYHQSLEKLNAN